jgi:hypothetical protein
MTTKKIFALALATIGSAALAGCNSCCPQPKGNPVYERPCCARSQAAPMMATPAPRTTYTSPTPAAPAPTMPKPSGGQMACGAGKCG